ncbi:carbon-nitrogen family hydrolase [Streptomyces sp. AJS327]|uniref:carbon-nitrogen family hydrolase n=1 Tax=Streptomyces sp. AJS327 TaxID=2545265 RepID=UPI0015DE442D|nr:carbon-nitrogen family hydrolase [Streptomyces sp. AJS327]MBA0052799.1 carbon-nitrogen family hydrolase [Streptomyces sp. AJS327]
MRASLIQLRVDPDESVTSRRERAASLVRSQAEADLVILPELWPVGAFAFDTFATEAEAVVRPGRHDAASPGPTQEIMARAARDAGVWLHAGSVVEAVHHPDTVSGRSAPGPTGGAEAGTGEPGSDSGGPAPGSGVELFNTSLVFSPDGQLARTYRKIHRFGFDRGEATLLSAGSEPVTVSHPQTELGLATCYDLRFPELFRRLTDAGATVLVVPAGWPDRRAAHWSLLARARAVENQTYVLACGTAGEHAGVPQAGRSVIVDPWGETLAEAAGNDEEVVTAELDLGLVASVRESFPVLRDRVL